MDESRPILVAGATGYVGGRLIPRLVSQGRMVRAMGRSLEKMGQRHWACLPQVELIQGDVRNKDDLVRAAHGCRAAYYLVHSMIAHKTKYAQVDRQSAINMRDAAAAGKLGQIIYLGGLGDVNHPNLSRHLASRHEVGHILHGGPVPVTTLRAAMILGSGSASFEILRYLTERLPVMVTPKWVDNPTQPIAITNVLEYLEGCLLNPEVYNQKFDIGGPDILNYRDLINIYAREARLPTRKLFPVPVLTPNLSARWIHLVTPVPSTIALPLTEGLSVPTICEEKGIDAIIKVQKISCRQAIRRALDSVLEKQVETCWSDAGVLAPPEWAVCGDANYAGGTVLNCSYGTSMDAPPETIWKTICSIGGKNGYYFANWLWRLRGTLDKIVGGVGLRRGRRHPTEIGTGDALDFFRVVSIETNRRLTLMAEMKVPGEAILDLQIVPVDEHTSQLRMISRFLPRGLAGIVYWYALFPFHVIIFKGMLIAMAHRSGARIPSRPMALRVKHQIHCALGKQ